MEYISRTWLNFNKMSKEHRFIFKNNYFISMKNRKINSKTITQYSANVSIVHKIQRRLVTLRQTIKLFTFNYNDIECED